MTRIGVVRLAEIFAALVLTLIAIALVVTARAHAAPAEAGRFRVSDGWVRLPIGGSDLTAAYFTLSNPGEDADKLVGVASPAAKSVEIHTMSMSEDVVRMRRIDGPVDLPGKGALTLEPSGMHLMLIGINDPLAADQTIPLTLKFEKAGEIKIELPVRSAPPGSRRDR